MNPDFILIAASLAWSFSLLAQECLVAHSQTHPLWMGSFVAVGEWLFHLISGKYSHSDLLLNNPISYKYGILQGVREGFDIIVLLHAVEVIGSFRTLIAWYAFSISLYCIRYEDSKLVKFLITLAFAFLLWSFVLDEHGNFLDEFCTCGLLGLLCIIQNTEELFKSTGDSTCSPLGKIVASIIFAFFGGLMTIERKPTLSYTFFWPVLPFLGIFAGVGKSFFLSLGPCFSSMGVLSALGVFFLRKVAHVTLTNLTTELVIFFSACLIFFSSLKTQKQTCVVRRSGILDFFRFFKKWISLCVSSGTTHFTFYNRQSKLFAFLFLTLCVMMAELIYGISSNSLGLIADAFHMFIDSASIFVGLCAVCAASWQPNEKTHPFGYARYEVLGGFVNGVLLLCVALFVVIESIKRMICPPEVQGAYLIHVSTIGLIVNMIGVLFFHESHGHSHAHGSCAANVDHNMRGVYLHVLADLLGSVSVMISSLIIYLTGIRIADPVCTVVSALFIAISALPLLNETGKALLLGNMAWNTTCLYENLCNDLSKVEGVQNVIEIMAWTHSTVPQESVFCTVVLSVFSDVDIKKLRYTAKNYMKRKLATIIGTRHIEIYIHIEDSKSEILENLCR